MAKRSIVILGINDGHDSGAALVKDGAVVAAVHEERLNNIKHYTGIPQKSIAEVFKIAHVYPMDVNLIALVSYDPPGTENPKSLSTRALARLSPLLHSDTYIKLYRRYKKSNRNIKALKQVLDDLGLGNIETTIIEHQLAHASAAYRSSPWGYNHVNINRNDSDGEILILTADGAGDALSPTVNIGRKGNLERIAFSSYYDSLGNAFYTEITRLLGLKPWDHESKVMGLAAYGKADYCMENMKKIICVDTRHPLRFKNTIGAIGCGLQPKLRKLLVNQRFDNIAAAAQQHLEDIVNRWLENAVNFTGIKKIACAGGIFLNVKLNKLLRECRMIDEIFFYPSPDDEGTPVGAALQGYYEYCLREGLEPHHHPIRETYYGPSYDDEQVKEALGSKGLNGKLSYHFCSDIEGTIADLILKGKIVGRCSGGAEWGPRALGNRSIIADPRNTEVIHKINFAIKQRDFWMPFAPSILEERKEDYLVNAAFAPYMIMAFDSMPGKEGGDKIPATVHPYDKTCRPQTVRREWNPKYYEIIKEFERVTGVGAILNTSFNLHGYPMVGTPAMAIWTLENSKLDAIALGNYLVSKH